MSQKILLKKINHLATIASFFMIMFFACTNQEVCENITTVPVRIGFYAENENDPEQPQTYTIDSITAFGINNDSVVYNNQRNVSLMELPLNTAADSSGFIFLISPADTNAVLTEDTIWIYYQRNPTLISIDCGFVNFFSIDSVDYSTTQIDTIVIDNSTVNNSFDVHLQVFPFIFDNSNNANSR